MLSTIATNLVPHNSKYLACNITLKLSAILYFVFLINNYTMML